VTASREPIPASNKQEAVKRLCVIVGDQLRNGEDEGEWIIGVKDWPTIRGAIYVDDINSEII